MVARVCTFGWLGLALVGLSGCPNDLTARTILSTGGEGDATSSDDASSGPGTTSPSDSTSAGSSDSGRDHSGADETSSTDDGPESSGGSSICGDGIRGPGEDCDDGVESATCNADCAVAMCGDGVVNELAGEECDDGMPAANGDGCSNACTKEHPLACDSGTDPFTGDAWVVCEASQTSAWVSAGPDGGNYHAQAICEGLGYTTVGAIGGTCGSPCSFCEGGSSCETPGVQAFNGGGNCGSDDDGPILCTTVMWICSGG